MGADGDGADEGIGAVVDGVGCDSDVGADCVVHVSVGGVIIPG